MSEKTKATPAKAEKAEKEKGPKPERVKVPQARICRDNGNGELRFGARFNRKSGQFETSVVHTVRDAERKRIKDKSRGKGATQSHADYASAEQAIAAGIEFAKKQGWSVVEKKGRDAFDLTSLPKPNRA